MTTASLLLRAAPLGWFTPPCRQRSAGSHIARWPLGRAVVVRSGLLIVVKLKRSGLHRVWAVACRTVQPVAATAKAHQLVFQAATVLYSIALHTNKDRRSETPSTTSEGHPATHMQFLGRLLLMPSCGRCDLQGSYQVDRRRLQGRHLRPRCLEWAISHSPDRGDIAATSRGYLLHHLEVLVARSTPYAAHLVKSAGPASAKPPTRRRQTPISSSRELDLLERWMPLAVSFTHL